MLTTFTPVLSLLGGALIGLASVLMMAIFGRIAGISGITGSMISGFTLRQSGWRLAFMIGMIASPLLLLVLTGHMPDITVQPTEPMLIISGLLVGVGVHYGSGCTSGHGVCGLARFSQRSLAATLTFMATTAVTVFIIRHMLGA